MGIETDFQKFNIRKEGKNSEAEALSRKVCKFFNKLDN